MKKVLLGTTALVAAGLLVSGVAYAQDEEMMEEMAPAEPISVSVGGYYNAAIGFASGSAATDVQSPSIAQDIEIGVGGSTTLDNGVTVGVKANIEGNSGDGSDSASLDERWIYFSGSFGDIQVGSIESASQQLTNFAPGAGGVFGVNSPFFLFTPGLESYITTYDDGIGNEDSAKLVFFSPSFNGFRVGASFAPGDTHQGQYGGNAPGTGMVDHTALAAEYSADFGGASIRAMIGHETYEKDGMCDSSAVSTMEMPTTNYLTAMYTVAQKRAIINNAFDADGDGLDGYTDATDREADDYMPTEHDMAVAKAMELWTGDPAENPLIDFDDSDGSVNGLLAAAGLDNTLPIEFRTGATEAGDPTGGAAPNCEPTAMRYGLTISSGNFAIGGGILTKDVANDLEKTSYDVGVSYSADALSVGLQLANATTDAAGGGETEQERIAINATYALGAGVSLSAQADEGEQNNPDGTSADWTQIMFGTSISF